MFCDFLFVVGFDCFLRCGGVIFQERRNKKNDLGLDFEHVVIGKKEKKKEKRRIEKRKESKKKPN